MRLLVDEIIVRCASYLFVGVCGAGGAIDNY